MPNWIRNELVVYGLCSNEKSALKKIFEQDHPFQKIYPMPGILENTVSPEPPGMRHILRDYQELTSKDLPGYAKDSHYAEGWREIICKVGVDEIIKRIQEDESIDQEEAAKLELAVRAVVATGYSNWYDWRNDKWGVKWDTDDIRFLDETWFKDEKLGTPDFIVSFSTPWGPPVGILQKLTEQYPDATFHLRWADEDDFGGPLGWLSGRSGVVDALEEGNDDEFLKKLFKLSDEEIEVDVND